MNPNHFDLWYGGDKLDFIKNFESTKYIFLSLCVRAVPEDFDDLSILEGWRGEEPEDYTRLVFLKDGEERNLKIIQG